MLDGLLFICGVALVAIFAGIHYADERYHLMDRTVAKLRSLKATLIH
jgi:hypothetical protein